MMRADASLHANQARLQVSEPRFDLAARPLLPQHDAAAPILADEVERILADINSDYGDFAIEFLGDGVLLCLSVSRPACCPGQGWSADPGPTRRNEFLPRSARITAISPLSFGDMRCSFVFGAPASLLRWQGWSTAGPSH
jgi:hypothetical protein